MRIYIGVLVIVFSSCISKVTSFKKGDTSASSVSLSYLQVQRLVGLPLKCVQNEFPNKLGQVLTDETQLARPNELHPAFYGCFDWHSSVHGHWLMIASLKKYPNLPQRKKIMEVLVRQLTHENITREIAFFRTKHNGSFERTYGWAWLLKLQQELDTWDVQEAKVLAENLRPLSDHIAQSYLEFLPKLVYPIRTGDHINTAFGLCFAYDYAIHKKNEKLKNLIIERSISFFGKDKNAPLAYEPSGYDFLSPVFEEIDLMRRVMGREEFLEWLHSFLPQIEDKNFQLECGKVSDRTDGKLVHLDGLNFSRAWCLYNLARMDKRYHHLRKLAHTHLGYSLPAITDGDYMGEHWLASFAFLALDSQFQ